MRKLFYIVFALASLTSNAEIWMPNIFSNDMILQRGEQNRFWGKATPNAKVTITANSTKTEVIADTNGKWSAMLPAFEATKSSFDIIFSENDNPQKTIKNVVVGEVWIAGGQSNMEFKFKNSLDKEQYIETSDTLNTEEVDETFYLSSFFLRLVLQRSLPHLITPSTSIIGAPHSLHLSPVGNPEYVARQSGNLLHA